MRAKALVLGAVLFFCTVTGFTGCGNPDIVGNNLVMQAREEYNGLDSARVVMTNVDTGKEEKVFTFMYSGDTLVYSDWKLVDGRENSEYNDGKINAYHHGDKFYEYKDGDKNFKKYTRSDKHQMTSEDMITYIPSAITDAKMTVNGDERELTHVYDVKKVNPSAPEEGEVTDFAVRYVFDKDGKLKYFTETTIYKVDGKEKRCGYKTVIQDKNNIKEVKNIAGGKEDN